MPLLTAALAYFALVFAAGFALGTARVLLLAPRLGETGAVALELPVMIALSWLSASWVLRRRPLPPGAPRLAMGAVAFALLMGAEAALAVLAFGQTPAAWAAALATPPGALGLAGQILFALIPWLHGRR
ncbi:MAG TPA: hypothetical protein VLA78_00005 [Paracoccaceae bacterium]|nr:hypothetical protein [Paracoccaceae bacterium]